MFNMRARDVIPNIVEGALPRFTQDKVLHLSFQVKVARSGENFESPLTQMRNVHFVFYRPNNYMKVGVYVTDGQENMFLNDDHVWRVTSDHDLCWRSDGVESELSRLYFELCRLVDSSARPIDLDTTMDFGAFGKLKLRELDGTDAVNYDREERTIQFTYKAY